MPSWMMARRCGNSSRCVVTSQRIQWYRRDGAKLCGAFSSGASARTEAQPLPAASATKYVAPEAMRDHEPGIHGGVADWLERVAEFCRVAPPSHAPAWRLRSCREAQRRQTRDGEIATRPEEMR